MKAEMKKKTEKIFQKKKFLKSLLLLTKRLYQSYMQLLLSSINLKLKRSFFYCKKKKVYNVAQ